MRGILSKAVAGSMIAGAALLVSACSSENNTSVNVTETNYTEAEINQTDDMTSVDAANGSSMTTNDSMSAMTNSAGNAQ